MLTNPRRWCFYINLPIGAVTVIGILIFFASPPRKNDTSLPWKTRIAQIDPYGMFVLIPGIICLLLALQWGGNQYPWGSARIIVLFVLFGILTILFVAIQIWTGDNATVPPRLLKNRSVAGACCFAFCLGGSFFGLIYYLPIWFQAIKGVSPTKSGTMSLPLVLALSIMAVTSGVIVTTFGYYTPGFYASTVLQTIGAGLMTTFQTNTGHQKWMGYEILYGFGIGAGIGLPSICAQTVLPIRDIPVGIAMVTFAQMFGGSISVSISQSVFQNQLISELRRTVPSIDPHIVSQVGATDLKDVIPHQFFSAVQVAYNDALTQTWYVSVALSCMTVFGAVAIRWKSVKGKASSLAAP